MADDANKTTPVAKKGRTSRAKKPAAAPKAAANRTNIVPVAVKISMDVLSGLTPQRTMLLAPVKDLEKATFILVGLVSTDAKVELNLEAKSDDSDQIRARFVNEATKQSLVLPIRSFLNLDVMSSNTDEYKEGAQVLKMYEYMYEKGANSKSTNIPNKIQVVNAEVSKDEDGKVLYPAYYYSEFVEAQKDAEDLYKETNGSLEGFDRGEIYRTERDMLDGLKDQTVMTRYANAEARKTIIVRVLSV